MPRLLAVTGSGNDVGKGEASFRWSLNAAPEAVCGADAIREEWASLLQLTKYKSEETLTFLFCLFYICVFSFHFCLPSLLFSLSS